MLGVQIQACEGQAIIVCGLGFGLGGDEPRLGDHAYSTRRHSHPQEHFACGNDESLLE